MWGARVSQDSMWYLVPAVHCVGPWDQGLATNDLTHQTFLTAPRVLFLSFELFNCSFFNLSSPRPTVPVRQWSDKCSLHSVCALLYVSMENPRGNADVPKRAWQLMFSQTVQWSLPSVLCSGFLCVIFPFLLVVYLFLCIHYFACFPNDEILLFGLERRFNSKEHALIFQGPGSKSQHQAGHM